MDAVTDPPVERVTSVRPRLYELPHWWVTVARMVSPAWTVMPGKSTGMLG